MYPKGKWEDRLARCGPTIDSGRGSAASCYCVQEGKERSGINCGVQDFQKKFLKGNRLFVFRRRIQKRWRQHPPRSLCLKFSLFRSFKERTHIQLNYSKIREIHDAVVLFAVRLNEPRERYWTCHANIMRAWLGLCKPVTARDLG